MNHSAILKSANYPWLPLMRKYFITAAGPVLLIESGCEENHSMYLIEFIFVQIVLFFKTSVSEPYFWIPRTINLGNILSGVSLASLQRRIIF